MLHPFMKPDHLSFFVQKNISGISPNTEAVGDDTRLIEDNPISHRGDVRVIFDIEPMITDVHEQNLGGDRPAGKVPDETDPLLQLLLAIGAPRRPEHEENRLPADDLSNLIFPSRLEGFNPQGERPFVRLDSCGPLTLIGADVDREETQEQRTEPI